VTITPSLSLAAASSSSCRLFASSIPCRSARTSAVRGTPVAVRPLKKGTTAHLGSYRYMIDRVLVLILFPFLLSNRL
jgi:hypothetical protein